jgi:hypothetical protein
MRIQTEPSTFDRAGDFVKGVAMAWLCACIGGACFWAFWPRVIEATSPKAPAVQAQPQQVQQVPFEKGK